VLTPAPPPTVLYAGVLEDSSVGGGGGGAHRPLALSKKGGSRGEALLDWTIAVLPPYQLANSLPCPIQVHR
jgi:hypothetical protein